MIFVVVLLLGLLRRPSKARFLPGTDEAIKLAGSPILDLIWGALILLFMMLSYMAIFQMYANEEGVAQWLMASLRDAGWDTYFETNSKEYARLIMFISVYVMPLVASSAILFWAMATIEKSFIGLNGKQIKFPLSYFISLRGRLNRDWSDVSTIKVQKNDWLLFSFRSGGKAKISLWELSERDRELLLYTALRLNPHCELIRDKQAAVVAAEVVKEQMENSTSFTHLWDDRFRTHMRTTTFVPLSSGESILSSKYSIVQQINSSAMAATYAARDSEQHSVIIKEMATGQLMQKSSKLRELFLRECELLVRLNHPRICKVLDTFSENERDYLVLEYLPGRTIRTFRDHEGKISDLQILKLALQMCDILTYLHEQDPPIIHRDVSPENWIVNNDQEVFLIDFGAANTYLSNITRTIIGKHCYMAPEQVRGKASFESDVYGLGATLYYLATGKEPEALKQCNVSESQEEVSDALNRLIADCTRLEQSERVQSMVELKKRIEESIQELSVKKENKFAQILKLKFPEKVKVTVPASPQEKGEPR